MVSPYAAQTSRQSLRVHGESGYWPLAKSMHASWGKTRVLFVPPAAAAISMEQRKVAMHLKAQNSHTTRAWLAGERFISLCPDFVDSCLVVSRNPASSRKRTAEAITPAQRGCCGDTAGAYLLLCISPCLATTALPRAAASRAHRTSRESLLTTQHSCNSTKLLFDVMKKEGVETTSTGESVLTHYGSICLFTAVMAGVPTVEDKSSATSMQGLDWTSAVFCHLDHRTR